MYIRTYEHGTRCSYLFGPEGFSGPLAVVDPAGDPSRLLAGTRDRPIEQVYLTSGRFEPEAVRALLAATGARLHAHRTLAPRLEAAGLPLAVRLAGGDRLEVGGIELRVLATPGIDRGAICLLLAEAYLFTGETLPLGGFAPDTPPADDPVSHYVSLRMLSQLPGDIEVLPGRRTAAARRSTLAAELAGNPLLAAPDLQAFLAQCARGSPAQPPAGEVGGF
ncbi:MAG: hypothetical protein KatS3mg102_2834 [Planctomycetota bacterium]|nr:MAG: hypothetical protein KatS3mg102_2834 [Planctomycetota bacterium]